MKDKDLKMQLLEELMKQMDDSVSSKLKKSDTVDVTRIESKEVPVEELPDSIADQLEEELELEEEEYEEEDELEEELDELFEEEEYEEELEDEMDWLDEEDTSLAARLKRAKKSKSI